MNMTKDVINSQGILILSARLIIDMVKNQDIKSVRESFNDFELDYRERMKDIGGVLFSELNEFRRSIIDYLDAGGRITYNDYMWIDRVDQDLEEYKNMIEGWE